MPIDILQSAWPVLAVLAYVLATAVLGVLASYHRHAIRVHDLVVQSKQRRLDYEQSRVRRDDKSADQDLAKAA